ncbi:MAG: hemerythrin domain-containing protein, partial [Rhodopila sp.]
FPLMRRGGHPMISQPIYVMTAEHDDHGGNLRELERLTNDFEPPDGACTTWRALYAGTQKFVEDLTNHIHIENNVLFPRFNA